MLCNQPDVCIRLFLFSFTWLQLMMLVTLMLRWHQLKWKPKRGKKVCKRTSTPNPRPLWNNWQNSRLSLKRMEQSLLGMLQWVRQSLGLWKCHLEGSPNLVSLYLCLSEPPLATSGVSWQKWFLILQWNAPTWMLQPQDGRGSFALLLCPKIWFCGLPCSFSGGLALPHQAWVTQLVPAVAVYSHLPFSVLSFGGSDYWIFVLQIMHYVRWVCCWWSSLYHN